MRHAALVQPTRARLIPVQQTHALPTRVLPRKSLTPAARVLRTPVRQTRVQQPTRVLPIRALRTRAQQTDHLICSNSNGGDAFTSPPFFFIFELPDDLVANDHDRAIRMADNARRVRAQKIVFEFRAMRSDHDQVATGFLGHLQDDLVNRSLTNDVLNLDV